MGRPRSLRRQEFGCRSSQWSLLKALAAGDVPHPALGTLADGGSQPIVEDPSSERGVWSVGGRPTIADGQGQAIYRGGGEAIRRAEQQENDQLVERLGRRMKELFAGLTLKQEEDNRRLREENLAIRKQVPVLKKLFSETCDESVAGMSRHGRDEDGEEWQVAGMLPVRAS